MLTSTAPLPIIDALPVPSPAPVPMPKPRYPQRTLMVALGLGLAFDVLFDGKALGISVPIFAAMFFAGLAAVGGREGLQRARPNLWLALPLGFFALMVFLRANAFVTTLNVIACLALGLMLAHFYAGDRVERLTLFGYPGVVLRTAGRALLQPPALVAASVDVKTAREKATRALKPVLRGLLIAVPVLVVFSALLASADMMFASLLDRLSEPGDGLIELGASGLVSLGAAFVCAGLIAYAHRRATRLPVGDPAAAAAANARPLGFIEGMTLILAVDALFLVFVAIQATYLFGGAARLQASDFTYADYARRGFFELVAVSTMTLMLILSVHRFARLEGRGQTTMFNAGCTAMVALTLVIVSSALKRLGLYEEVYGYTETRLYVHIFMFILGGILAWRAITLWWKPERFAIGAFVASLGFLAVLDAVNPDAVIARWNIERYHQNGQLDAPYLAGLSADAVPEIARSLPTLQERDADTLTVGLAYHLGNVPSDPWQSFHLSRARAWGYAQQWQ